jgi:hypothetical protein
MQKAKRTVSARMHASKTMKEFFSDPINRQKRSMAMKGNFQTLCIHDFKIAHLF